MLVSVSNYAAVAKISKIFDHRRTRKSQQPGRIRTSNKLHNACTRGL